MGAMKKLIMFLLLFSLSGTAFCEEAVKEEKESLVQAKEQTQDTESIFAKEGLTSQEFLEITSAYYNNPRPDKLISCLKVILTQNEIMADEARFAPFAHFTAAIAHNDETVMAKLKELNDSYAGKQKVSIERIISEAENFKSPAPDSPKDLDYLWAEYSATGQKEPVQKIIAVFDNPENATDFALLAAAEFSLKYNAETTQSVYLIIEEASANAQGTTKQVLDKILKSFQQKWQKYGFVKKDVLDDKLSRLDQMIKDNPDDAANYLSRAIALANNLNYNQALSDFLKALSLNPNLPIANNYVGFIYLDKGKIDQAEPYLKKAIEQSPKFSKPYFNLARIYLYKNELDNAIAQISKAMELQPDFYEAYLLRSQIYFNKKQYYDSIADLKKVAEINPELKQQVEGQIKVIRLLIMNQPSAINKK